jgi:hypothetical protein
MKGTYQLLTWAYDINLLGEKVNPIKKTYNLF